MTTRTKFTQVLFGVTVRFMDIAILEYKYFRTNTFTIIHPQTKFKNHTHCSIARKSHKESNTSADSTIEHSRILYSIQSQVVPSI